MTESDREMTYAALKRERVRFAKIALLFYKESATAEELIEAAARFGRAWKACGPPEFAKKAS